MATHVWVWHGIPFRPSRKCYGRFDYLGLPQYLDVSPFIDFRTVDDVRDREMSPRRMPSPGFTEWAFPFRGVFMADRREGLYWQVDSIGRVIVIPDYKVAAESLPEFLTRVDMEDSIWWAVEEEGGWEVCDDPDPDHVWEELVRYMSKAQLDYLQPYYARAAR